MREPQVVHPLRVARHHHAAGQVQAARLPRQRLELAVERNRVGLELGDVRIAVQRVEPARRVPGRPARQLRALDQHHVGPAGLGQVVEHRAADDAAADHHHPRLRLHGASPSTRLDQPRARMRQPVDHVEMVPPRLDWSAAMSAPRPVQMLAISVDCRTNSGRSPSPTQACTRTPGQRLPQRRALGRRLGGVEPQRLVQLQPQQRPQVVQPADRAPPGRPARHRRRQPAVAADLPRHQVPAGRMPGEPHRPGHLARRRRDRLRDHRGDRARSAPPAPARSPASPPPSRAPAAPPRDATSRSRSNARQ